VVTPYIPDGLASRTADAIQARLMDELIDRFQMNAYVLWYSMPMAIAATRHLSPLVVIYDCMDELAAFAGAPAQLSAREAALLEWADVVFTGGWSLYEARRARHPRVYPFPSSVDVAHFARARQLLPEPDDQRDIPAPRLGFFGVIDERMDLNLVAAVADARPDWQHVFLGPVMKIDPAQRPHRPNIYWLGPKPYASLPEYIAGWQVAWLPFVRNEATRYLSPTKTPEYLASGTPVVSTSIRDVVRAWGDSGLVTIADSVADVVAAMEAARVQDLVKWLVCVDSALTGMSWECTWQEMARHIDAAIERHRVLTTDVNLVDGRWDMAATSD